MQKLRVWITSDSLWSKNLGLTIMRIGLGLIFIKFGYHKLMGGTQAWHQIGSLARYIGLGFWPTLWGFLAACAEFFGGIALVTGIYSRLASFAIALVMLTATIFHVSAGDAFMKVAFPLSLLIVLIGLIVAGSGSYAFDTYVYKR